MKLIKKSFTMFAKLIVGTVACILGYFGITGYTSSIYGIIQTNKHNINAINTKLDRMNNIMLESFKDSNHIITNIQSNLGDMNVEVNTKLNKIDADIYTVQTEVHDTKMATEDIRAILLSYSDNKYLEKPLNTEPTQSAINWFKW